MAVLDARERAALHVLAFLFFRMGAMERAERIYAALAALPPVEDLNNRGSDASVLMDAQAVLGLAAVALERNDSTAALEHVQSLLVYIKQQGAASLLASTRQAVLKSAAHLVRAQAFRALGNLDAAVEDVRQFRESLTPEEDSKRQAESRS